MISKKKKKIQNCKKNWKISVNKEFIYYKKKVS